jgi:hypothetical protein
MGVAGRIEVVDASSLIALRSALPIRALAAHAIEAWPSVSPSRDVLPRTSGGQDVWAGLGERA